jgi:8-oxo-dGTP pyrophosphatase MutT (NUDIX family)
MCAMAANLRRSGLDPGGGQVLTRKLDHGWHRILVRTGSSGRYRAAVPDDDLIASVAASVRARVPVDEREAASIERTLAELDRLPAPLDEDADAVHVTGSAFVVGPRGIVLLKHRRLGIWVQPGGHVDPGETPWDAARREAVEETGLALRFPAGGPVLAHVDVHPGGRGHTHLDLRYVLEGGDADPSPPPEESQDVHWFGWDEAAERAEPAMGAIIRRLAEEHRVT